NTSKIDDYGKLLGPNYKKHLENLRGGERVEMGGKKNITDFALWKFAKQEDVGTGKREMERDSPRGVGFPGRHAECSAMSSKYLGEQFDIHHGGADHISIHHPNEIAQSECCFGKKPWVKYWLHNQFLQVDGGRMGKSLGNMYSLQDIQDKGYDVLDLRYFFFMAHYRSFQDFTWENLTSAQNARKNLKKKIAKYSNQASPWRGGVPLCGTEGSDNYSNILTTLFDDFNTPNLLAEINKLLKNPSEEDIAFINYLDTHFLKLDLFTNSEDIENTTNDKIIPEEIITLAEQRKQAKIEKNYTLADELRNKIQDAGYTIKDTAEGYELNK
ncbi:MAG: cysteine--tRNA ligase, partial [candidate division SR1 bacterium]